MASQQITASDIANWDSLGDIADSFEKRGLKPRPSLGEDHEFILQLDDDEFVTIVEAGLGEPATEFKPENRTRHTNLVATNSYNDFTFITRIRSWGGQQHGRIKHQKISFSKDQFTRDSGEKNTVLKKLNSIEYGSSAAIHDTLYDTQQVVEEFYEEFEDLRTDLVQEVSGIPDDRGDAKQRYVQVILDRMIFLYFIQEKRLLDRNPNYLHEQPGDVVDDGEDRYENFYRPLFFDYLAEDKQNPDFGSLPYLNGGLFAKNPIEEDFPDAKLGESAEETNEFFDDILDFLSEWNWNVDERLDIVDPKNLSPAILGHIFEQTVNQKEMGAYYTPEEITGFMSRRTIHPYLLDQLNEAVGAEYEEIDDVFGFDQTNAGADGATAVTDGGAVTAQVNDDGVVTDHVETLYHDVLTETRVLDPAVGSGAFLLAAQEVLLDIYMQCLEYFQRLEDDGRGWDLQGETRDLLEEIEANRGNTSLYAKRAIILNNLYGVDIDDGAVEICKLRLWLSMVADIEDEPSEVDTLPNIDFNIRQGNSLIGRVDHIEVSDKEIDIKNTENSNISDWEAKSWQDKISKSIKQYKQAESSESVSKAREEAEDLIGSHREKFDRNLLQILQNSGLDEIDMSTLQTFDPFHWTLEFASVYDGGGFDVLIGNPPWDVLTASRDDFFSTYDEAFRSYSTGKKDDVQEKLLKKESISDHWEEYNKQIDTRTSVFTETDQFVMQSPTVAGQTSTNENELSALFLERVFSIVKDDGYVSQILPSNIFNGSATKDLRLHLLNSTSLNSIIGFENNGIFSDIDNRKRFGIVTFKNIGESDKVRGIFRQKSTDAMEKPESELPVIPKEVLSQFSPEALIFPAVTSQKEADVLFKLLQFPSLSEQIDNTWKATAHRELVESYDKDRWVESDEPTGDYPVLRGANFYQYSYDSTHLDIEDPTYWSFSYQKDEDKSAQHRIREKGFNKGTLKKEIYKKFGGESTSQSQKSFVNDLLAEHRGFGLEMDDIVLDCSEYRIVFRDVTNASNERTMIAAVISPGPVCVDSVRTIKPFEINVQEKDLSNDSLKSAYERTFTDREMFAFLGLLNSIPYDFVMSPKVSEHIPKYKFEESQVPRLTDGDEWFRYISSRAARLSCYGDEFAEMRDRLGGVSPAVDSDERQNLRAEIDAASFHAYGLNQEDLQFILDDFPRVQEPMLMTNDYFELVSDKYYTLSATGPHR